MNSYGKWTDCMKKHIGHHKYAICSFIIVFFILFVYAAFNRPLVYFADSMNYDQLADSFISNNLFDFHNYPDTYRGYLLPFILFLFKSVGNVFFSNSQVGFLIMNACVISFFITIIIPYLLHVKNSYKKIVGAIVFSLLFVFFWPDFLLYPLSDVYSLFFFSISILCIIKVEPSVKSGQFTKISDYFWILAIGFSMYASYNIRTVYQIPNMILLLTAVIRMFKYLRQNIFLPIAFTLLLVIGYLIPAIPQMEINKKYNGVYTPSVITDKFFGSNLSITQVFWGIKYTRYETNIESFVNNPITYPTPGVKFVDATGKNLLEEMGDDLTLKNLLVSYLNNPNEYFKLYLRHAVNGFTPIFRESYITDMSTNKMPAFILNYGILFLFMVILIMNIKFFYHKCFYLSLIAFATIIAIPGAIEPRFTLPSYLVIYGVICYLFNYKQLIEILKNKRFVIVMSLLLIAGFIYNYRVIDTTFKSTEENVPVVFSN